MPTLFENKSTKPHVATSELGLFTSFAEHPKSLRFETQQDEEEIVLFLRQHLVVLIPQVFITLAMLVAPSFIFPFFLPLLAQSGVELPASYIVVGTLFWYLATFGFALSGLLHWFFNIYIVTTRRIVDIDFVHLLYKEFSEAELTKIEDLTFAAGGLLSTVFNFGNVFIQTAGEVPNFEFHAVPQPDRVVKTISSLLPDRRR